MEAKEAVTVSGLWVVYKSIEPFSIKRNLFHMKKNINPVYEAVKGVSFTVNEGEILGITGKNGSGKSTLLRAIANIFTPDSGTVDLHGKTVSLLSIGVGFNNNLTGRKNIELSGLLLGFSETMVKAKMEEIIEFAELGEFIDRPVRTYSSGMHSKLAFAITACLDTEIMLVDEVLSVGDERFKKKSFNKMKELITQESRTVIIVSHNLQTLKQMCDRVIWMHDGEIREDGKPGEVIKHYKDFMSDA